MKLYFSAEYSGCVGQKIRFILNNILRKMENYFLNKSYGEEIMGLSAIPIIVDYEFSDVKERKYISRKDRESDVRLKIDYDSFLNGTFEQCCDLVYENCIKSFDYVYEKSRKKSDGDFYKYYNSFVNDFTYYFKLLKSQITNDQVEEFNRFEN